ncbi:MAG: hypothetical protein FWJ70_17360 [Micromonosporaceae bacterium]
MVEGMSSERRTWTGRVNRRLRCCICGGDTTDAEDYVLLELTAFPGQASQWLGAHAEHLNRVLAAGFEVEIHKM